jgi:hypothetical protein
MPDTTKPVLSEARKGEIAVLVIKQMFRTKGIHLNRDLRREVGSKAKEVGVPFDELMAFGEELTRSLVEEVFNPKHDPSATTTTRV